MISVVFFMDFYNSVSLSIIEKIIPFKLWKHKRNCKLNGFKTYQIEMTGIGRVRVPMLVCHPFELGRVAVAGADVLGLQVLQLAVDVVSLAHDFGFKLT